MSTLSNILRENRFRPEDVDGFTRKLFYEGSRRRPYLERFFVLLILATIIATTGIIGDSTATVIGAMIIAPLMTPIMATAAALIMGQTGRAVQSLMLVTAGVAIVIGLSWLYGMLYPGYINFDENSQIVARVSPRLIDLFAALASGAAGAFCMSREDIADSLPGVAIAISLVPPLCVVGVSFAADEIPAALGALLLFVTNFLAIILAGGGVLAILGLTSAAMIEVRGTARRNAFALVIFAIILVAFPLLATGRKVAQEALTEYRARETAVAWVADTNYDVRLVQAQGDIVTIAITGLGDPPSFETLVSGIRSSTGRAVDVTLEILPAQEYTTTLPPEP